MRVISAVADFLCGLHNLAKNWSWERDVNGRDRDVIFPRPRRDQDVGNFRRDETEMRRWYVSRPRPQPCLDVMNEEKDLGVCITNNLKSARQCQLAYSKANKVLGLIARTTSYKDTDVLLELYKTLVLT